MALFRIPDLRRRFGRMLDPSGQLGRQARAQAGQRILLGEARAARRGAQQFDVFLSHSYADAEQILYVKRLLESYGHTVYVDWIDDQHLARDEVDADTANIIRGRILSSRSLLVTNSTNAESSRWIPWELGYADGAQRRVGTIPFVEMDRREVTYEGAEYLGLYPYVTEERSTSGKLRLWVRRSNRIYVTFDSWLEGEDPRDHP